MTKVKLKEIASICTGYPFRSRIERDPNGEVGVIQMKDIDDYNCLNLSDVYKVCSNYLYEKHLLKQDDILFCSRGVSHKMAVVTEEVDNCVAASPLMVIQVKSPKVNPAFLVWYFQQPDIQKQINRLSEGTSLLMVSKSALETLVIDLPPLKNQKAIAQIAALSQREQQIIEKLAQRRKVYIDAVLMQKVVEVKHFQ
ncbi:restriction endonuclease subunit S [Pelatocladus sp. BLCC-F211]|uniref:restriction endonuclease subunit S n=1 Tax=Pelatocladus sp. BLCC-F211 TaxID=3342752 RepID=UPI0035B93944